jgi:hypothetical protein
MSFRVLALTFHEVAHASRGEQHEIRRAVARIREEADERATKLGDAEATQLTLWQEREERPSDARSSELLDTLIASRALRSLAPVFVRLTIGHECESLADLADVLHRDVLSHLRLIRLGVRVADRLQLGQQRLERRADASRSRRRSVRMGPVGRAQAERAEQAARSAERHGEGGEAGVCDCATSIQTRVSLGNLFFPRRFLVHSRPVHRGAIKCARTLVHASSCDSHATIACAH